MSRQIDGKLHNVTIEAHFIKAITNIKFPSLFFVTWKTNDHKHTAQTGRYSAQQNIVTFEQKATLTIPLIFDQQQRTFVKKDTQIQLNLVSKNRPDQPKLVGRITLNVTSLLNNNPYSSPTDFPLQFCSVNASLTASFRVVEQVETDIQVHELQKSIGEGVSFHSTLRVNHQHNSILDRSKDSVSVGKQISSSRLLEKHVIKSEVESNGAIISKGQMHVSDIKVERQQKKEESRKQKQPDRKSQETNSARGAKIIEVLQSTSHKKIGSVLSEESKYGQENTKLKVEIETLKLQINRMHQQSDKVRSQYSKKVKQCEFSQLQLKQKQSTIQQSTHEIHILKTQANRLRQEMNTLRDEAVKATIKIAELKDNLSKVSAQLSTSQTHLKRLQGASQQSSSANKEFTIQIIDLQKQITKYENKCLALEHSKNQLQSQLQVQITRGNQKAEKHHKQMEAVTIELETVQNQLKAATQINKAHQNKVSNLEDEVKRLILVQEQFLEARNSWSITEEQLKEQRDRVHQRVNELEDTLISLNQRIRYLESENELLAQNCKKSHEDYQNLQAQKQSMLKQAEQKYLNCFTNLDDEKTHSLDLQTQKNTLEQNIDALIAKYEELQANHQNLTNQFTHLRGQNTVLAERLEQNQKKCMQLEELIILGNEQRQREQTEAADREKNLELKVKQLESQNQYSTEQITMFEEKVAISEQELKGREELIEKLQDGLNTQIERTESLNDKLITYFQKDERMKDLLAAMENQQRRLCDLIQEQEKLDETNQSKLVSKQAYINDLVEQLQASQQYSNKLTALLEEKNIEQEMLTLKLDNAHRNIQELQTNNQENVNIISQMEQKNLELQNKLRNANKHIQDKDESHQQRQNEHIKEVSKLNEILGKLEGNITDLEAQLIEKEGLLIEENQRFVAKQDEANLLSEHITALKGKQQQLLTQKSQLQSQLFLKEEILNEENRKYSELQNMYETLANDQATFDMNRHRDEMRERLLRINELQSELRILGIEVSKIPTLERAVKIKTIELNSLKFKDKSGDAQSELIKLKDQQISSLQREKEHLLNIEREFMNLQFQFSSLRSDIELIEEEKFDVESLANQRALALEEAKQENKKLIEEITIIGQKHGQLQKMLHELTSNQGKDPRKEAASLKAQNIVLNRKLTDYQKTKQRLRQLEDISKRTAEENLSLKIHAEQLQAKCNLAQTYQSLRKLIEERIKGKQQQKIIQAIEKIIGKDAVNRKAFEQKVKNLTKDFGRMKIQLLKVLQGKNQQDKVKFIGQVQTCENSIGAMVLLFD